MFLPYKKIPTFSCLKSFSLVLWATLASDILWLALHFLHTHSKITWGKFINAKCNHLISYYSLKHFLQRGKIIVFLFPF